MTIITERRISSIEVKMFNKYEFSYIINLYKEYKCREKIYYLIDRRAVR